MPVRPTSRPLSLVHHRAEAALDAGVPLQPAQGQHARRGGLLLGEQGVDERELRLGADAAARTGRAVERARRWPRLRPSRDGRAVAPDRRLLPSRGGGELGPQRGVLGQQLLRGAAASSAGRPRDRGHLGDRFRVLDVGVDGGHHDARLDREQVDAHQGDPHPGVDDDALVQDAVQDVDQTGATGSSFDRHFRYPLGFLLFQIAGPCSRAPPRGRSTASAATFSSRAAHLLPQSVVLQPTAGGRPRTGSGPGATSRARSAPPCRSSRREDGCGSSAARPPPGKPGCRQRRPVPCPARGRGRRPGLWSGDRSVRSEESILVVLT